MLYKGAEIQHTREKIKSLVHIMRNKHVTDIQSHRLLAVEVSRHITMCCYAVTLFTVIVHAAGDLIVLRAAGRSFTKFLQVRTNLLSSVGTVHQNLRRGVHSCTVLRT
jgi:hypothetical protein